MSYLNQRAEEMIAPAMASEAVARERSIMTRQQNETAAFEAICDMRDGLDMLFRLQQRFNWRLMNAGTLWNGIEGQAGRVAADLRKIADAIEADVAAVKGDVVDVRFLEAAE